MKKEQSNSVQRSKRRKNGREQGEQGKMSKGAGSIDPPNRASMVGALPRFFVYGACASLGPHNVSELY